MHKRTTSVLATLGIAAAAFALPAVLRKRKTNRKQDDEFYKIENTPSWAPPTWAFPVAWSIITVALAWSNQRIYRQSHLKRRAELLTYFGLHWAIYVTFQRAYFGEKSPVLAAVWTASDFAVCHLAFYRALGVDRAAGLAFIPANLWLTLALPLSMYQAAANKDPIFGSLGVEIGEVVAGSLGVTPLSAEPQG